MVLALYEKQITSSRIRTPVTGSTPNDNNRIYNECFQGKSMYISEQEQTLPGHEGVKLHWPFLFIQLGDAAPRSESPELNMRLFLPVQRLEYDAACNQKEEKRILPSDHMQFSQILNSYHGKYYRLMYKEKLEKHTFRYVKCVKNIKTEAVVAKREMNDEWNFNFLQNGPPGIQHTNASKFYICWNTFVTPVFIKCKEYGVVYISILYKSEDSALQIDFQPHEVGLVSMVIEVDSLVHTYFTPKTYSKSIKLRIFISLFINLFIPFVYLFIHLFLIIADSSRYHLFICC